MKDSYVYEGVWSSPSSESKEVSGTLTFDIDKSIIELSLASTFGQTRSLEDNYQELIIGYNDKGKAITLHQCRMISYRETETGIKTCRYRANVIFVGAHFSSIEDLKFDTINGDFSNFYEWLGVSGIIDEEIDFDKIRFEYRRPEEITFTLSDHMTGKFSFGFRCPFPDQTVSLTQTVSFEIHSKKEAPFKDLVGAMFHFKDFLSLAQFESVKVTSLDVSSSKIYEEHAGERYSKIIEVYLFGNWAKSPKNKSWHQMIFSYKDISLNFNRIIKKWYEIKDRLSPSIDFLVDSVASDRILSENSFLNVVQAVETFHRRFRKNQVLPTEEYKAMKNSIIEDVSKEFKEWLSSKLHFANEPTLHDRLKSLLSEYDIDLLTDIIDDKEQFIRDIKNSRNYYTHYDSSLKKKAKTGSALFLLTEKLKVLLLCLILRETEFDDIQLNRFLRDKSWILFNHILPKKPK
ncbi:HEPN domain-containing protein [Parapedobacter sp. DT-150]|uniref:ApeA N-terminal domain 1-containing protein n=1 Tax=Parapedobacter sp. DT-150 TaxID=3396162 RepID=UPI003F1BF5A8